MIQGLSYELQTTVFPIEVSNPKKRNTRIPVVKCRTSFNGPSVLSALARLNSILLSTLAEVAGVKLDSSHFVSGSH